MSDEIKKVRVPETQSTAQKTEPSAELREADLDNVVGGKGNLHDINVVKQVDNSSPKLT